MLLEIAPLIDFFPSLPFPASPTLKELFLEHILNTSLACASSSQHLLLGNLKKNQHFLLYTHMCAHTHTSIISSI